ncbi:MAG: hypothetical protein IT427_15690, partial [Pirellulales bacterium]|nr:hypothetical protein [Pirellulales bacterium]
MTASIEDQLHTFATTLLERRGALVDWPDGERSGTVLLPPQVARAVGAEVEVAALGPEVAGDGLSVNLAGDFLQWSEQLLQSEPRTGVFRLRELYLKRKDLDEAIARAFTWLNAKVGIREAREMSVEYHTWWFHGIVASDDRWETRFPLSLNAASGVEVSIPDPLSLWELEPQPAAPAMPPSYPRATALARKRLLSLAAEFLERMDARLLRDRKRLRDYYHALVREANKKKSRSPQPTDPEKVEAVNRAVQLELRRKLAELDDRYAMVVNLVPVILIRTETPVLAVDLWVQRKRASKIHTVYWNPLIKQFEPMLCNCCGQNAFGVAFTNDDVQPRCG